MLVASLVPDDLGHAACDALLNQSGNWTTLHSLNETFATLTGGRLGIRVDTDVAARLVRESIVPALDFVALELQNILGAQASAKLQGVRGGAIYNYTYRQATVSSKSTGMVPGPGLRIRPGREEVRL